jgi:hypothetical protein
VALLDSPRPVRAKVALRQLALEERSLGALPRQALLVVKAADERCQEPPAPPKAA